MSKPKKNADTPKKARSLHEVDRCWGDAPPAEPGEYEMRCDENGFKPERMTVAERGGELWVNCPDLGWNPLAHYHDNLCGTQWRKAPIQ